MGFWKKKKDVYSIDEYYLLTCAFEFGVITEEDYENFRKRLSEIEGNEVQKWIDVMCKVE
jgi:hypothetical protein